MWPADDNHACYPVTAYRTTIREIFQDSSAMCYKIVTFGEIIRVTECWYWEVFREDLHYSYR